MKKEDLEKAKELEARIKALEILKVRITGMMKVGELVFTCNVMLLGSESSFPIYTSDNVILNGNDSDFEVILLAIDERIELLEDIIKNL